MQRLSVANTPPILDKSVLSMFAALNLGNSSIPHPSMFKGMALTVASFCGTTTEFCGKGCQSGCDTPKKPSCGSGSGRAENRRIGYYESWNRNRKCNVWDPIMIDANKWTHINYAFALVDGGTYQIAQMNSFDTELYPRVTGLKERSPGLKVYISVGGWDAGGRAFSEMASNTANRATFIQSALVLMRTYSFDGIDIDWEYPVANDREGSKADFSNFVTFLKELKAVMGGNFGVTVTLPASYWYLQGFDITKMDPYVDWFNMMSKVYFICEVFNCVANSHSV